jgi:PAS domain S-box-containing protein
VTFMAANEVLGDLAAEQTARIISAVADVALVIDGNEVILDTTISRPDLKSDLANASLWAGQTWSDIVTDESRPKVKLLVADAGPGAQAKWRQLAHPAPNGDVPILYYAMRIRKDRVLAIGRDMRAVADLQQRLVETQASMERDYSLLRHAETRYRVLFHTTPEPVLVIDAATENVVEANPAAVRIFGGAAGHVTSRNMLRGLDADSAQTLKSLASRVRNGQTIDDARIRSAFSGQVHGCGDKRASAVTIVAGQPETPRIYQTLDRRLRRGRCAGPHSNRQCRLHPDGSTGQRRTGAWRNDRALAWPLRHRHQRHDRQFTAS